MRLSSISFLLLLSFATASSFPSLIKWSSSDHWKSHSERSQRQATNGQKCTISFSNDCDPILCADDKLTLRCSCPSVFKDVDVGFASSPFQLISPEYRYKHNFGNGTTLWTSTINVSQKFMNFLRKPQNREMTCKETGKNKEIGERVNLPERRSCDEEECGKCHKSDNYCSVGILDNQVSCETQINPKKPAPNVRIGYTFATQALETHQLVNADSALSLERSYCTNERASAVLCLTADCDKTERLVGSCETGWIISQNNLTQFHQEIQIRTIKEGAASDIFRFFVIPQEVLKLPGGKCLHPNGIKDPDKDGMCPDAKEQYKVCGPRIQTFTIFSPPKAKTQKPSKSTTSGTKPTKKPGLEWWTWLLIGMAGLVCCCLIVIALIVLSRRKKKNQSKLKQKPQDDEVEAYSGMTPASEKEKSEESKETTEKRKQKKHKGQKTRDEETTEPTDPNVSSFKDFGTEKSTLPITEKDTNFATETEGSSKVPEPEDAYVSMGGIHQKQEVSIQMPGEQRTRNSSDYAKDDDGPIQQQQSMGGGRNWD